MCNERKAGENPASQVVCTDTCDFLSQKISSQLSDCHFNKYDSALIAICPQPGTCQANSLTVCRVETLWKFSPESCDREVLKGLVLKTSS